MLDLPTQYTQVIIEYVGRFGFKILCAVALWIVGGLLINLIFKLAERGMIARKVDPTLISYTEAGLRGVLRIALIIAILSVFGIETTSFAAIIAAAGVAIGMAWSGLLANFAAGIFLMILKPVKVGDTISSAGVTGTVIEIGLFATSLNTSDNLHVTVGNNKLFGDNIVNFNVNQYRRVDLTAQLAYGVDVRDAIARLKEALTKIPNVLATPAPVVEILEFNNLGPKLAVRPFCHGGDYGKVFFATNMMINDVGVQAGWPIPGALAAAA